MTRQFTDSQAHAPRHDTRMAATRNATPSGQLAPIPKTHDNRLRARFEANVERNFFGRVPGTPWIAWDFDFTQLERDRQLHSWAVYFAPHILDVPLLGGASW